MKKTISIILTVIMIMAMTGCASDKSSSSGEVQQTETDGKSSVSLDQVQQMAEKEISAVCLMLGDNWDEKNLPERTFLIIANAQYLYKRDNGVEMPTIDVENELEVNEGIKIDVLIPVITKYYPFSREMLRNSFESSAVYNAQTDAVVLTDWGWNLGAVMQNVTDNQNGTYDISYGLYSSQGSLEYKGVVKAKIHPDGYMQFISNTLEDR